MTIRKKLMALAAVTAFITMIGGSAVAYAVETPTEDTSIVQPAAVDDTTQTEGDVVADTDTVDTPSSPEEAPTKAAEPEPVIVPSPDPTIVAPSELAPAQSEAAPVQAQAVAPSQGVAVQAEDTEPTPEFTVTNVKPANGSTVTSPVTVSFDYVTNVEPEEWFQENGTFFVWIYNSENAQVVDDRYEVSPSAPNGSFSKAYPLPDGTYEFQLVGFYAQESCDCAPFVDHYVGTFTVGDETDPTTPPVAIEMPKPVQTGEFVEIPAGNGGEYYNIATGETIPPGKVSAKPSIVIGTRPTGKTPVTGGPWSYEYKEPETPATIEMPQPVQNGGIIKVLPIPGGEYYNIATGETIPSGNQPINGKLDVNTRPTGNTPVTGGPWSYEYTKPTEPSQPIDMPKPVQTGEFVDIPVKGGGEYYDVDTNETLPPGKVSVEPSITIDVRPTGNTPVTGGPWSYEYTKPVTPVDPTPETPAGPEHPVEQPTLPLHPINKPINQWSDNGSKVNKETYDSSKNLAVTGANDALSLGLVAGALLLLGTSLVLTGRRRRRTS